MSIKNYKIQEIKEFIAEEAGASQQSKGPGQKLKGTSPLDTFKHTPKTPEEIAEQAAIDAKIASGQQFLNTVEQGGFKESGVLMRCLSGDLGLGILGPGAFSAALAMIIIPRVAARLGDGPGKIEAAKFRAELNALKTFLDQVHISTSSRVLASTQLETALNNIDDVMKRRSAAPEPMTSKLMRIPFAIGLGMIGLMIAGRSMLGAAAEAMALALAPGLVKKIREEGLGAAGLEIACVLAQLWAASWVLHKGVGMIQGRASRGESIIGELKKLAGKIKEEELIAAVEKELSAIVEGSFDSNRFKNALEEFTAAALRIQESANIGKLSGEIDVLYKEILEGVISTGAPVDDIFASASRFFSTRKSAYPEINKILEAEDGEIIVKEILEELIIVAKAFHQQTTTKLVEQILQKQHRVSMGIKSAVEATMRPFEALWGSSGLPEFEALSNSLAPSLGRLLRSDAITGEQMRAVLEGAGGAVSPAGESMRGLLSLEKKLKEYAPMYEGMPAGRLENIESFSEPVRRQLTVAATEIHSWSNKIALKLEGEILASRHEAFEETVKVLERHPGMFGDLKNALEEMRLLAPAAMAPMAFTDLDQPESRSFRGRGATDTWQEEDNRYRGNWPGGGQRSTEEEIYEGGLSINDLIVSKNILSKSTKGNKIMNLSKKALKKLVKETLNEGQAGTSWPYQESGSETGGRDLAMEFSELVKGLSEDPGVDHSIGLAKIFVKDNDLFSILLDLVKNGDNEEVMEKIVKAHRQQEDGKQNT